MTIHNKENQENKSIQTFFIGPFKQALKDAKECLFQIKRVEGENTKRSLQSSKEIWSNTL